MRLFDVQLEPGYQALYHWHHNDGVFVTRVILHPGEATELYAPCGMLVSVSGGNVVFDTPDGKEKVAMDRASFKWRKLQQSVKLTNVGSNVFHGVDIRIK